ncbi:hypothetical protein VTO73DRAFT_15322 [Trametes versicolor]
MFLGKLLAKDARSETLKQRPNGQWKITVGLCPINAGSPANAQVLGVVINGVSRLYTGLLHTPTSNPAAPYIVARNPLLNVGSPSAFSLAKVLINECVHQHIRCSQISPSSDVRLPSHLVDCTRPARPRLVYTKGVYGRYLALSYVWGEEQPHQTTTSNVSAYSAGIDAFLLPQTIRDAISVTHTLGFQYLWADSLCIVQDSDEDKLHELGRMHLIYRYAYFTIIAASAERVSDGFLQRRRANHDITLPFLCPVRPPAPGKSVEDVLRVGKVRATSLGITEHGTVLSGGDSASEPIHKRGWCLQELYMSPRALIFTSETLRFRCQQITKNVGNSFYHPTSAELRLPDVLFCPGASPTMERRSKEWWAIHRAWTDIVHQYTRRTIGKASDKLVACGALAEAFHRVLGSHYVAGLWCDTLLQDLLWVRMEDDRLRLKTGDSRPAQYRAPSWSWAAVEGAVRIRTEPELVDVQTVAEVVRCDVALSDQELPFGEVTGGVLVLRAALIQPDCALRFGSSRDEVRISSTRLAHRWGPNADGSAYDGHTILEDGTLPGWCTADYAADRWVGSTPVRWLVPLLRHNFLSDVHGLIVVLADPGLHSGAQSRKVYRRVGQFRADADSWDSLWQAGGPLPLVEIEIV